MSEPEIEQTPDAKRLQLKNWTCRTCGSMFSRSQDAERHWLDKHHAESHHHQHHGESHRRDEREGKPTGKRK